jgi:DNA invertase Pin-like site-specific DNA recombinase
LFKDGTKKSSTKEQKDLCKKFAIDNGLTITDIKEEVHSGYYGHQPCLTKLISSIPENSVILVSVYDRFSRNLVWGYAAIMTLLKKGVHVISVSDKIDYTTPSGNNQLRIALSQAQMSSEVKGVKQMSIIKEHRDAGNYIGTTAPYGYSITTTDGIRQLVPNDHEQLVIKLIIALRDSILPCKEMNKLLFKVITKKTKPNLAPLEFVDCDGTMIEKLKPKSLKFYEIAEILNSYEIQRRDSSWTLNSVRGVYNKNITTCQSTINPNCECGQCGTPSPIVRRISAPTQAPPATSDKMEIDTSVQDKQKTSKRKLTDYSKFDINKIVVFEDNDSVPVRENSRKRRRN